MRRFVTFTTSLAFVVSGLGVNPAQASPTTGVIPCVADGNVGGGGSFTVTKVSESDYQASLGASCKGKAEIPEGVTRIAEWAFSSYHYDGVTELTKISIPASVTSIGAYAFYYEASLKSVTFATGSQLTTIEDDAFSKTSLTAVAIPASVTSIGRSGFDVVPTLASVTFAPGSKLTFLGDYVFELTALKSITIPAGVTSIGEGAFLDSVELASITFAPGSKVTAIGDWAFENTALESITIPASVTSVGKWSFSNATSLNTITFASGSKLASIGKFAFENATALTSIAIPASVTSLGEGAFLGATALTGFYFRGDAPTTVGANALTGVATGAKAYIKSGATGFDLDTDGDGNSGVWNGLVVTVGFYTVTYNTTGGSEVNAQDYGVNLPTPTSPTRTGYTFAGWSATAGGPVITWPNTPALASDITLYAKWTRNSAKAAARVKPTVSGTAKVSKTLTAKKGTWSGYPNPALTYQWYSCTKKIAVAKASVPSTCKKITGGTKSTLKLVKAQKGKFIAVLVTGTSGVTSSTKWLSKSTSKVK